MSGCRLLSAAARNRLSVNSISARFSKIEPKPSSSRPAVISWPCAATVSSVSASIAPMPGWMTLTMIRPTMTNGTTIIKKQAQEDLTAQFKSDANLRSRGREPDGGHDGNADIQGQTASLTLRTWLSRGALGSPGWPMCLFFDSSTDRNDRKVSKPWRRAVSFRLSVKSSISCSDLSPKNGTT